MSNIIKISVASALALTLVSCASTTIYPKENGTYQAISTSSEQGYAEKDIKDKAEKLCQEQGKHFVMLNHQANYSGPEEGAKVAGAIAGAVFGTGNLARSSDDNKVNVTFKCA